MAKISKKIGATYPTFSSFIIASIIYICIIFFLFFKIYTREDPKKYTNQKDAFMDIYVVQTEVADTLIAPKQAEKKVEAKITKEQEEPKEEQIKTTNKQTPEPQKEEPKKEVAPQKETPNVNLSELFSNTKLPETKSSTKPEAVQSNKQSAKKTESSSKSASDIFKSLQKDITSKAPKAGMTGEYNKFFGDISEIIQRKWVVYKADTNNNAKVQVFIDKFGKLSYNIISLSYDKEFNNKVRDFLERLKEVEFPVPPNGQTASISLTLIDQIDTE